MAEWMRRIRAGAWGSWLQARLAVLEKLWGSGVRGARLALDSAAEEQQSDGSPPPPQVFEAWKLLKIVFLQYAPSLLEGKVAVSSPVPDLVASFAGGTLQAVGKLQFDEAKSEVYAPLAVTRYTLSYEVKGTDEAGAVKDAGRAILAGWIDERDTDIESDLVIYTFPASAFAREHYIRNGAESACEATKNRHSDEECADMAARSENCDCDVRLCLPSRCTFYFVAGTCQTATILEKALGVKKGCYSLSGVFTGAC